MKRERLTLIPIEYLFIVFGSTQKGTSQKSRNNNIDAFCKRRAIIMIFSTYGSEPFEESFYKLRSEACPLYSKLSKHLVFKQTFTFESRTE